MSLLRRRSSRLPVALRALAVGVALVVPATAAGTAPPAAPPAPAPAPAPGSAPPPVPAPSPVVEDARIDAPRAVAPGGRLVLRVTGLQRPVRIEQRRGSQWVRRGEPIARPGGATTFRAPATAGRLRVRATGADGRISRSTYLTVRALRLAAVGDINLGDGPGAAIDRFGANWPWESVGPRLRSADIAFGNLECAISVRGSARPKQYTFRGRPSSLRALARAGGFDVLNLANNHSGDFGRTALLDTLRHIRRNRMLAVGAGATEAQAYRPVVVERLGLRVAFVGFGNILPFEFRATGSSPGSAWAFPQRVRAGIARARREADVVIATFHWGIEKTRVESGAQRTLARLALAAGASAVIGAHPHVLQPIRRPARGRLVAYSLGNFVFSAASPGTQNTGILEMDIGADGVGAHRLRRATIVGSRPILRR